MAQITSNDMDAIELLMDDHAKVQDSFDQFERTQDAETRKQIYDTVRDELIMHTRIEEDIFYPAVRAEIDDDDLLDEAEEEHHVAKIVLSELENMSPDDEHYAAKFTVLAESVRHHIEEEESEMFPKVRESSLDLEDLGEQMDALKQDLKKEIGAAPRAGSGARTGASSRRDL